MVKTEDGYINKMFRVFKGEKKSRPAAMLVHGVVSSAETWIVNKKDKAQAFILAEAGYDVWVPNLRGNRHSKFHESLNPNEHIEYWEMTNPSAASKYDMPAFIDFAKNYSNVQNVTVIGHSKGNWMMFNLIVK